MERPVHALHRKEVGWLLLRYFYSHSDAKDTAEGITNWWLRSQGAMVHEAAVEVALMDLVTNGWLIAIESRLGHRLYALNVARRSELERWCSSRT